MNYLMHIVLLSNIVCEIETKQYYKSIEDYDIINIRKDDGNDDAGESIYLYSKL